MEAAAWLGAGISHGFRSAPVPTGAARYGLAVYGRVTSRQFARSATSWATHLAACSAVEVLFPVAPPLARGSSAPRIAKSCGLSK